MLSLRRAPNLGKLARATRIPAPGPISSSLTLTQSPCGICRLTPPVRIPRQLAPTMVWYYYYATTLLLVSQSGRDHLCHHRCGVAPSLR